MNIIFFKKMFNTYIIKILQNDSFFFLTAKILLIGTTIQKKYIVGKSYKTESINKTNKQESKALQTRKLQSMKNDKKRCNTKAL
jgi:hypothetical protein